jgi:hypothetical protein
MKDPYIRHIAKEEMIFHIERQTEHNVPFFYITRAVELQFDRLISKDSKDMVKPEETVRNPRAVGIMIAHVILKFHQHRIVEFAQFSYELEKNLFSMELFPRLDLKY